MKDTIYIGQKIYILSAKYLRCKLELDHYGNSLQTNGDGIYCDSIEYEDYCFSKCQNGYAGYEVVEDRIAGRIDQNTYESQQGFLIELEQKNLKHHCLNKTAYTDKASIEEYFHM